MERSQDINVFSAQVFVAIYESLNALSVAKSLDVPPSKISRCLAALRHTLDDQLFIRRQYGFEPTPMADKLYPYFQQLLTIAGQIQQISRPKAAQPDRVYNIHAPATLRGCLFNKLQRALADRGERYTLSVKPIPKHDPDALLKEDSDLVLAFKPGNPEQLDSHFIADGEQLFLIARDDHPLLQAVEGNMLSSCLDYPFLIVTCPAFNDRVDPLELYAIDECRSLTVAGHVGGVAEAAEYLRDSDAFTFVASQCAATFFDDFPGVRARRFSQAEFDRLHQRSGVPKYFAIQRKDRPVPEALMESISVIIRDCVTLPVDEPATGSIAKHVNEPATNCAC